MAQEEPKKIETETSVEPPPAPAPESTEPPKDVAEEKLVVIPPPLSPLEEKPEERQPLAVVEKVPEVAEGKVGEGSVNRDAVLARVETEKRISLIKAWEESEKSKAENKAQRKLSAVGAWENSKKAALEAEQKKIEEQLEKKKAEYVEKMKNKVALIHKAAEEKRAIIEAQRGEELLKAEEAAAKYRATGTAPKKIFGCF
ncbi:hypothetical protein SLEP1_g3483 [Rubroshorea leprosula]|uniref:Remorin n=1 Tax=Rubroshorea leprosula TaxID=152421 RepID=A0AAV5HKJ3_9ROSI|nr:hypothetical protein SLEP1_g3483 [Rubroshorea leprosula]